MEKLPSTTNNTLQVAYMITISVFIFVQKLKKQKMYLDKSVNIAKNLKMDRHMFLCYA